MKYCEEFSALLDLFVDGELSPGDMVRVQAHLDGCAACRAYVDDALAIRAAFPLAEDTAVPDGFAEGVMERVKASPRRSPVRRWGKPLASLAACCAIVLLLAPLLSGGKKAEAPAMAAATADAPTERAMGYALTAGQGASAEEKAVEESAAEEGAAPYSDTAAPETEMAAKASLTDAAPYSALSTLSLPPEAAFLLADFTPVEECADQSRYELSQQEYADLVCALDEAKIPYTMDDLGSETVQVLVEK